MRQRNIICCIFDEETHPLKKRSLDNLTKGELPTKAAQIINNDSCGKNFGGEGRLSGNKKKKNHCGEDSEQVSTKFQSTLVYKHFWFHKRSNWIIGLLPQCQKDLIQL